MKKQPFCSFMLAGLNLNDYGLVIPSPFVSLELTNSEIQSFTSWTLNVTVGGDSSKRVNVAAFEALLYSAAQAASGYEESAGIPVSFIFGWLDDYGNVSEYTSYQGFTLQFEVSTTGRFLNYAVKGYASVALKSNMPVLNIPELCGIVQPSAVVEALALAIKADTYYELDIDHCDSPTLINHGALTTSFSRYVRGNYTGEDNYDDFPGLLKLSKSYNSSRDAAGLVSGQRKLSCLLNNLSVTPIDNYLKKSNVDTAPQCSSFSFWIDEPTMTSRGVIHYKSNAGFAGLQIGDTLEFGTANTNVFSISGSYNGVAYNMTDMNFSYVGFTLDGSGNQIMDERKVVNSWSSSLSDVFQTVNIINDVNAIASQFSGSFNIVIPGSVKQYTVAQPISLLVMSGNTLSPISGVYNIVSVTHNIGVQFTTTLKVQRLVMSSANQVASQQNIYIRGSNSYSYSSYTKTSNIISTGKVDFGTLYPDFERIATL